MPNTSPSNPVNARPLTHQERLELLHRPFPTVRVYGGPHYGGVTLHERSFQPQEVERYGNATDWADLDHLK